MREKLATLKAEIRADLQTIQRIYDDLARQGDIITSQVQAIVVGYHLHNLYSAFEDIFERITETFENGISDAAHWQVQLLKRMALDIEGIRPRVLSAEAYACLDELRRFRHVFRSMYAASLDAGRLALVVQRAKHLRTVYQADLDRAIAYLDRLQAQT